LKCFLNTLNLEFGVAYDEKFLAVLGAEMEAEDEELWRMLSSGKKGLVNSAFSDLFSAYRSRNAPPFRFLSFTMEGEKT
jgi:hypothetical protein